MSSDTPDPVPDSPAPDSVPGTEDVPTSPECTEARRLLSLFVSGGITRQEERAFREHILACTACRDQYRETVGVAATLGNSRRRERVEEVRLRRQEQMRTRAFVVGNKGKRGKRFGLRIMIPLVLIFVLLTLLNPSWNRSQLTLEWEAGEVRGAETLINDLDPEVDLGKGDWCLTEHAAAARIEIDGGELLVGGRTHLMVEDPSEPRVRLQRGRLEADGTVRIVCQFGIAELVGSRAAIELADGRLELSCLEGKVNWIHAGGTQTLSAGETADSDFPGALVTRR